MSKARQILLIFTNFHHQIFCEFFWLGRVDDLLQNDSVIFHGADKLATYSHQTRSDCTLKVFRCAHVNHAGGDGARGETMLHQCDKNGIHDAHIDRSWFATKNLHKHHFRESFFTDQILD